MSLKEEFVKAVDNVKDTFNEAGHKAAAESEQTKRDVAGDSLTPGEQVGSVFNQAKNNIQAGVDSAKVDARNET